MPAECKSCLGLNVRRFNGELAIHFPGLDGLNEPIVWVFPELAICPNCGFTQFFVGERELRVLVEGKPVQGAIVFDEMASENGAHAG